MNPLRTWTIDTNIAPPQATAAQQFSAFLLRVKRFLTGAEPLSAVGAWTVRASSNGVTASAADLWATEADVVSAAAGTAHSWILLRSPPGMLPSDGYVELLIDCSVAGTESVRCVWSHQVTPFGIGALTTLNAPANPTNALENTSTADRQILENTPALFLHTLHLWRTERGDFLVGFSQNGTGRMETIWTCLRLDGGDTPDSFPVAINVQRQTSGNGALAVEGLWNGTSSTGQGCLNWWIDGGVYTVGDNLQLAVPKLSGSATAHSNMTSAGSAVNGSYPRFPLDFYNNGSGRVAYRGRFSDFAIVPGAAGVNTLEPGSDAVRRIIVGDFQLLTLGDATINL